MEILFLIFIILSLVFIYFLFIIINRKFGVKGLKALPCNTIESLNTNRVKVIINNNNHNEECINENSFIFGRIVYLLEQKHSSYRKQDRLLRDSQVSDLLDISLYRRDFNVEYSQEEKQQFFSTELCKVTYINIYMDLYLIWYRYFTPYGINFKVFYKNFFNKFNLILADIINKNGQEAGLFFVSTFNMFLSIIYSRFINKNIVIEESHHFSEFIEIWDFVENRYPRRFYKTGISLSKSRSYDEPLRISQNQLLEYLEGFLDFLYKLELSGCNYSLRELVDFFESKGFTLSSCPLKGVLSFDIKGHIILDLVQICLSGVNGDINRDELDILLEENNPVVKRDFKDVQNKFQKIGSSCRYINVETGVRLSIGYCFNLLRKSHLYRSLLPDQYPYFRYKNIYLYKGHFGLRCANLLVCSIPKGHNKKGRYHYNYNLGTEIWWINKWLK